MLAWLKQRQDRGRNARSLYGSIVTQARSHGFYAHWGVPDTAEGRFELIGLHLVLVLHRLAREGEPGRRLGQVLTETFVVDMDDILREMTVGDLAVPRHVKRAVAVLHDRHAIYGAALTALHDGPLTAAIETRLAASSGAGSLDVGQICAYIRQANRTLDRLPSVEILAGRVAWPQVRELEQGVQTAAG